jgi:hypothetical protein
MKFYRIVLLVLLVLALVATACSSVDDTTNEPLPNADAEGPELPPFDPASDSPPMLLVRRGENELTLMAFTYCWTGENAESGICAGGFPPANPKILAGEGPIEIYFPLPDFSFESRFWDKSYTTETSGPTLKKVEDHWELTPPEVTPAIVEVFGFNDNNDVIVSFLVSE